MAALSTDTMARPLDALFRDGALGGLSDAELLERFPASGAAFDVLMARHGTMVLAVCRRILRDGHAADDAFQVTFLVLAQRAQAIRRRESLGPWLHGVARRVALRARAAAAMRQEREARAAIDPAAAVTEPGDDDVGPALHAEIDRLPEKYRAPIVLCYLEGRTIEEASRQLGWPVGTVGGRLARARDRLRHRLVQQGLVAPALLVAPPPPNTASVASVPRALAVSTRAAALQLAAGRPATAVVPAIVANLLEQTVRSIAWTRFMIGAGICGLLGTLAIGAAGISLMAGDVDDPTPPQQEAPTRAASDPHRPAANPVAETLNQASKAAAGLNDSQEKLDAYLALAWAQIKTGDPAGAHVSLDRATEAASALELEPRCYGRVQIAQARGEAGDKQRGLDLLADTRIDVEQLGKRRIWLLRDIAKAQGELGDRVAARATIKALDLAILSAEDRLKGRWNDDLFAVAEAQLAIGDVEEAFMTCIPSSYGVGANRKLSKRLEDQASMLTQLASAAADDNHQSRHSYPARLMSNAEKVTRLAIVRRAVKAAEALSDTSENRVAWAAALGELGAFDEALLVARRVDQKQIQQPGQVDAMWAFWRISFSQAKAGNLDAARATLREASRVETPPKADSKLSRVGLASSFVVARSFDEAIKIAETLDPEVRAEILSQVARHKQRDGDRAGAEALFRRALMDAGRFLHSPPPQAGEEPGGPVPAAREDGPDQPGEPDPNAKHQTEGLCLLARIHASAGDWASAARTFAVISPEDQQQRVTALLIAALRSHFGDVAGALAWARSLPSASLRAWALRGLAMGIFDREAIDY